MSGDKYFLVSDSWYQIKKECQVCCRVHTLSVFSFENLSPESQRHCPRSLGEIMAHPRMERTLGFHTPTWCSCRLNESLVSHLTRDQSYAAVPFTGLERSVWILSTPTRWRPNAEPTVGLRRGSAPPGTKGAK